MTLARTVANTLTLSRALIAPLILIALIRQDGKDIALALVLIGVAITTDYLDGVIARHFAVESRFGKVADAFTDALVFLAIFVGLSVREVLPPWLPAVFAARETVMYAVIRPTFLRLGIDPGARVAGKVKTVLQGGAAIAVIILLWTVPEHTHAVAVPLVSVAAAVSVISLYWYVEPIAIRRGWGQLTFSIIATCASLWLLQLVIVVITAKLNLSAGLAIMAALHTIISAGLATVLLARREDFLTVNGLSLKRVNPANVLTLVRLTSIPSIILLLTAAVNQKVPAWPALILLSAVMFTDLADGMIARRRGQVTIIGGYLDSSTDYLLLGSTAILLLVHGIGTPWVFVFLIGRLAIQAAAVIWIAVARRPLPAATSLGKISIAVGMVLLSGELSAELATPILMSTGIFPALRTTLELLFCAILAISAIEKIILSARTVSQERASTDS